MKKSNTQKLVMCAILAAVVVVLQVLAEFIPLFTKIALTLAPIIVGGALYGKRAATFLGLVFSVVVLSMPSTIAFYTVNWWATILIVLSKGVVSAFAAAWVYELISKKNSLAAVVASGIVLPVLNTGIFWIGAYFFFAPVFQINDKTGWPLFAAIGGIVLTNFAVEIGVNIVLSTGITTVIKAVKKSK